MKFKIVVTLMLTTTSAFAQTKELPQLGNSPVKEVIAAMTLDEKINFIKGTGMKVSTGDGPIAGSVDGRVLGAAGVTYEIPRLGIPAIVVADGPAGLRIEPKREGDTNTYYATAFPVGTALASTWNTELVENVGKAMGSEVLEYGVDILLAPGINLQRNPLCGRNFEYYSEDPLLNGKIASAMVDGLQSNGIGVSVKHFAANNQETFRSSINANISQRALREIYLKGFEIAVKESKPWTIMSAYNKINGTYTSESYDLLTTILRDEWEYDGFVMTDWFGGRNYPNQVKAGNDLLMPGRPAEARKIRAALEDNTLTEAELDRNIERILNIILKTPTFKQYKYSNKPDLLGHAKIAREAATEGMVLLKNDDNSLPFKIGKIALLGNASYKTFVGGTGSGEVNKAYTIPFYDGLKNNGFNLSEELKDSYVMHVNNEEKSMPARVTILDAIKPVEERVITQSELAEMAKSSDIGILTIGRNAGEGADRSVDKDYYLNKTELNLIENASKAFHEQNKKLVIVLNIDAIVDVAGWQHWADAILVSWLPGQEAGNAIADVIKGNVNPSGHLAQTIPASYNSVPSATSFPGTPKGKEEQSDYSDGIYVGYRYYNSFDVKTAFEFGHGLSYTTFEFSNIKLSSTKFKGKLEVSLTITNTGKVAGKEVVQLYLSAPSLKIDKPTEELKAFVKTKLLKPREKQRVSFIINSSDLASFYTSESAWVAESGAYAVKIGASSKDIRLSKKFVLADEIVVEKVNDVMVPVVEFNEIVR